MTTLQMLVQIKRNELELEQQDLFNKSVELFKIQLDLALGHEIVVSMDLDYFTLVNLFIDVDYEDIKASFRYNDEIYEINLTKSFLKITPVTGSVIKCFKLEEAKDKLVDYLANIKPFHKR